MTYNASYRKSNIVYDLSDSPYNSTVGEFIFYFSTLAHKEKFDNNVDKKIDWLVDSLSRRFHVHVECGLLAMFQLYQQVEGRGFYVEDIFGNIYKNSNEVYLEVV